MKNLLPFLALTILAISANAQTNFKQNQDPKTTLEDTFNYAKDDINSDDIKDKTCIIYNGSLGEISIYETTLKTNSNRGPLFPEQTKTFPWTSYITMAAEAFDNVQVDQSSKEIKVTYNKGPYILTLRKSGNLVPFTLYWSNETRYGYCW